MCPCTVSALWRGHVEDVRLNHKCMSMQLSNTAVLSKCNLTRSLCLISAWSSEYGVGAVRSPEASFSQLATHHRTTAEFMMAACRGSRLSFAMSTLRARHASVLAIAC